MTSSHDPAVQRRRLREALRDLRTKKGFTQKRVAEELDWSPSKVLRIENGGVTISKSDLIALLRTYGVSDEERIDDFVGMAQDAKRQSWSNFRDVLTSEFITYLGYESSASIVRQYETLLVPGILQTEAYARATFQALAPRNVDVSETLDRRIQARMARQELLQRDDAPTMHFILDEAAVWRRIGPEDTMIHQLEHLLAMSRHEKITLQILPFSRGEHPGLRGPFAVLEFPAESGLDPMLYVENARGDFISTSRSDETAAGLLNFADLEDLGTPKLKFVEEIGKVISDLRIKSK